MSVSVSKRLPNADRFDCFENSLVVVDYCSDIPPRLRRSTEKVKLAMFDLDETLITTQSKKVFSQSSSDWKFKYTNVVEKLSELNARGFLVFIVTNQLGISKGFLSVELFNRKIAEILKNFTFRVVVLAATKHDRFRKPCAGAFDYILQNHLSIKDEQVDRSCSFFCGDAAGRIVCSGGMDHSSADLLFALNTNLLFKTPEEFFQQHKSLSSPLLERKVKMITPDSFFQQYVEQYSKLKKMVVFIAGPPRSGKTFLASFFKGFDILRVSNANCRRKLERLREALNRTAFKIVIDFSAQGPEPAKELEDILRELDAMKVCFRVSYDFEFVKEVNYHSSFEQRRGSDSFSQLEKQFASYKPPLGNDLFCEDVEVEEFVPQFGRHPIEP